MTDFRGIAIGLCLALLATPCLGVAEAADEGSGPHLLAQVTDPSEPGVLRPPARVTSPVPTTAVVPPSRITTPTVVPQPVQLPSPARPPQPPVAQPVTPRPTAAPTELVRPGPGPVILEVSKGTLIRLPQPASTVFVADPDIADVQVKSPTIIYLFARKPGETVLYAVSESDRVLANTIVRVTHNLSGLRQAIRGVAGEAPIEVSTADNTLVVSGSVASSVQAEDVRRIAARFGVTGQPGEVVNQLKVMAPNQVNLRVRVAEMSRETIKAIGVNWDAVFNNGTAILGIATGNPVLNTLGQFIVRNPIEGAVTNSIVAGYRRGDLDLNAVIDALDQERLITVLAEPNLTALSGETASFLAGGEFPIPVPQDEDAITIEFKQFGVSLAFTPTVLDGSRISLRVRPEVSELSLTGAILVNNFTIPALTTRRAETTVELGSGQSFAIAGLIQNNTRQDVSRVPGLGDVPILGALFRSDRFRRNESELVIIVTPYVVRPVSAARLASPQDGFVPPRDVERIMFGETYRERLPNRPGGPRNTEGRTLMGPVGFILE